MARARAYTHPWHRCCCKREFANAEGILAAVLENVGDGSTVRLLEPCRRYSRSPPPADWDGITHFDHK